MKHVNIKNLLLRANEVAPQLHLYGETGTFNLKSLHPTTEHRKGFAGCFGVTDEKIFSEAKHSSKAIYLALLAHPKGAVTDSAQPDMHKREAGEDSQPVSCQTALGKGSKQNRSPEITPHSPTSHPKSH